MEAPFERSAELPVQSTFASRRHAQLEHATAVSPFEVERLRGAAETLERIAQLRLSGSASTGFQSEQWLAALFQEFAPHAGAEPNLLIVRRRYTGSVALALPLLVRKVGLLRIAEFADLGLSDYCAPLIGEDGPVTKEEMAALLKDMRAALSDVDVIRLEKMPTVIEGSFNPLLLPNGAQPSRFSGNQLTVATTVKDYIASRGKKYRKEVERSRRRLEDEGEVTLTRVTSPSEIDRAYRLLEAWQVSRHMDLGHEYCLDQPEISAFYRELLVTGRSSEFASLFTLNVNGQPMAALLGITQGKRFTLLRIADAGEAWSHCSPGRMIVIETMHDLVTRGITTFDMGIGSYPFKRWIGCEPYPLYDRLVAISALGRAHVLSDSLKRRARANPTLLAIVRRIRHLSGRQA